MYGGQSDTESAFLLVIRFYPVSIKLSQAKPSQFKPSQFKPIQAKPIQTNSSQAKPSQAKPSRAIPAFDRIARLSNGQLNSNRGIS